MDEKARRADPSSVNRLMNAFSRRRFVVAGLIGIAATLVRHPAAASLQRSSDDEFTIVNGWILKTSDLQD
jgi:hypothetical protein